MHNIDIQSLLEHTQNEITSISKLARNGTINKVNVKNTLENLRSILDYAAQDIQVELKCRNKNKVPDKVYFPYGQKENLFKISIQKNLPGLSEHLSAVHTLVQNMQPFKCGDPWLVDLCGLTNDAKHNNLSKTENKKSTVIHQGGVPLVEIGGEVTKLVMTGNRVNDVLQDDVYIDGDGKITIKLVSGQTLITENNKIHFQGKQIEVAPFLDKCHENLSKFAADLAKELSTCLTNRPT